jgi:hypothetical protein
MLSRFIIGQLVLTEPVVDAIRKTLKKVAPDVKVTNEELLPILEMEVLKREVLEGDKACEAKKKIAKALVDGEKEREKSITQ